MTVQKGRWFQVRWTNGGSWLVSGNVTRYCKALGGGSWVVWTGKKCNAPKTLTTEQMQHDYQRIEVNGAIGYVDSKTAGQLNNEFSLVWE